MKYRDLLKRAAALADPNHVSTEADRQQVLADIQDALEHGDGSPWWVVVLKVLAYAIGLILAGYGTTAAAATLTNGLFF